MLLFSKARKEQGFTAVKMNATEDLGWLDSPHALDDSVERLKAVKALGMDAGVDFHGRVHKPVNYSNPFLSLAITVDYSSQFCELDKDTL